MFEKLGARRAERAQKHRDYLRSKGFDPDNMPAGHYYIFPDSCPPPAPTMFQNVTYEVAVATAEQVNQMIADNEAKARAIGITLVEPFFYVSDEDRAIFLRGCTDPSLADTIDEFNEVAMFGDGTQSF